MVVRVLSPAGLACALLQLAVIWTITSPCLALEFDMMYQTKCIMEEIDTNIIVVGDFLAYRKDDNSQRVALDVKVRALITSSTGQHVPANAESLHPRSEKVASGIWE
jgi:hypothetical protein